MIYSFFQCTSEKHLRDDGRHPCQTLKYSTVDILDYSRTEREMCANPVGEEVSKETPQESKLNLLLCRGLGQKTKQDGTGGESIPENIVLVRQLQQESPRWNQGQELVIAHPKPLGI